MPHINLLLCQAQLDLGREPEETKIITDRRARLTYSLGKIFLLHIGVLEQTMVGKGYLNGVEILTLDILDECHFHNLLIVCRLDVGGDSRQTCPFASSPTPLPGYNQIGTILELLKRNRLHQPDGLNRESKLRQTLFVEGSPRLIRVGLYTIYINFVDARGARSLSK